MPPARISSQPAALRTPASREAATADLKRRYEERIVELKTRQVQRYVSAAEEAERRRDLVSATNAFRIATSLAPDDIALAARLHEIEERAQVGLADSYLEQAQYEEKESRWPRRSGVLPAGQPREAHATGAGTTRSLPLLGQRRPQGGGRLR